MIALSDGDQMDFYTARLIGFDDLAGVAEAVHFRGSYLEVVGRTWGMQGFVGQASSQLHLVIIAQIRCTPFNEVLFPESPPIEQSD